MTIPSTTRKAGPLLGTGAQTTWPFTFKVFATTDILVITADSLGVETVRVINTDYSVALNANQETSPGGTVTYPLTGSALPVSGKLTIIGNLPYDQPLDLPSGGNFSPLTLENELDRLTMQVQQVEEVASRAVQVPVTSSASPLLPAPETNALLGWNTAATAMQNYPLEDIATGIAFATYRINTFTGNGSTMQFALDTDPAVLGNMDVAIDGLTQVPGVDYVLTAGNAVFTVAPSNGAEILVRYGQALISVSADANDVSYTPAGTGAVATTVQTELRTVMLANNFGADATGTTDTTTQLQLAIAALNTAGTGTLIFDGQYNLGTNTSGTIEKFRITASNVTLIFRNGTKFTCTSNNHLVQLFVLAGVSNVNFEGVLSAESAVTNTYTTTGTTGIRAVSIENNAAGDSGNIHIEAIRLVRGAAAVVVGSAYTSNNRVQGIYIGDIYTEDVTYGINCANNGDTVRCNNLTTDTAFRSWFAYGCKDHSGNISSLNHYASGTVINLSRYSTAEGGSSTNTEGYNLSVKVIDAGNNVTIASLRHVGDGGATQKIQGIYLNISSNVLSTGLTALSMLNFASAGGAITATTFSAVITNIRVDISTPDNSNAIYVDVSNWNVRPVVTFSGSSGVPFASIRALASVVNLQVVTGTAISDGVFESNTFTPTIVGTTLAGVGTYTTQVGSYTKIGNRVLFNVALDWSTHTGTGNMRMAGLPFTSNALANNISAVSLVSSNIALTASNVLSGAIASANTQVIFYQTPVGGGAVNTVPIDTAGLVYVSGHYNI